MSGTIGRIARGKDVRAAAGPQAAPDSEGGGFASLLAPADLPTAIPTAAAAPMASSSLIQAAVEDVFARQAQDREARRHGRAMLQALGALQLAALRPDDDLSGAALARLAATVQDDQPADDPVLRLILREIAVLAAVELARRAPGNDVSTG